MKNRLVSIRLPSLFAPALLAPALLAGCIGAQTTQNPPEPMPEPPPGNPPAPIPAPEPVPEVIGNPPAPTPTLNTAGLPTWDQVPSSHPKGATNPPIPELIVTPDGQCYKKWASPMMPASFPHGDRVQVCAPDECGTRIQCPEKAEDLLERYRSGAPVLPTGSKD